MSFLSPLENNLSVLFIGPSSSWNYLYVIIEHSVSNILHIAPVGPDGFSDKQ